MLKMNNQYLTVARPQATNLIKRDSYESFHNKVYASAIKVANEDQKIYLKAEVKKQKIRTRSK